MQNVWLHTQQKCDRLIVSIWGVVTVEVERFFFFFLKKETYVDMKVSEGWVTERLTWSDTLTLHHSCTMADQTGFSWAEVMWFYNLFPEGKDRKQNLVLS